MTGTAGAAADLQARLVEALRRGQIVPHFQPIVALPSARTMGFEALARWSDPQLGPVPPDVFIPVAERSGLIHDLGAQVLAAACHEAMSWPEPVDGTPPADRAMSVNVSPVQLASPSFVDDVATVVRDSGLDPRRLVLEITESAAIEDLDNCASRLRALRRLGVRIALDDFGVGHSALGLLRRLPLDILKIDRSFVGQVHQHARDAVIVRLLIDTAHSLGLIVCAEGVETREQARQLVALGCDTAQGWYYGRPQPPSTPRPRVGAAAAARSEQAISPQDRAPIQIGFAELVVITDAARAIRYASPGSLPLLGYTPSDLLGTTIDDHLHPDDLPLLAERVQHATGSWPVMVHRALHRDGSYRWLSTRSQVLRDGGGWPTEIVSTSRDVTTQVEVERQLASSQALLQWAFEQSPVGLAISDFDGAIVRANAAFAELLGYDGDSQLVGQRIPDITHPDDRAVDALNHRELLSRHGITQHVAKRYLHRDGSPVGAQVWATTLDDEGGEPAYVVAHILPH